MTDQTPATPAAPPRVLYTSIMQHAEARKLMESAAVLLSKAEKFQLIPSDADAEVASEFRARLNQTIKDLDTARLASTEEHRALVAKLNAEANEKLDPMKAVLTKVDKLLKDYLLKKEQDRQAALQRQRDEEALVAREKEEAEAKARAANEAAQQAARDAEAARTALTTAATPEAQAEAQKQLETAQATQQASINVAAQQAAAAVQLEQRQETLASLPAAWGTATKSIQGTHGSTTGLRDNWVWKLVDVTKVPEEYLLPPEDRLDKKVLNAKAKSVKKPSTTAVPGIEIFNDPIPASRTGR